MRKKRFSYSKCMEEFDKIIPSTDTVLPNIDTKSEEARKIKEILTKFKLPVLYRYMPLEDHFCEKCNPDGCQNPRDCKLKRVINDIVMESVYLSSADTLNDVFEGAVYSTISHADNDTEEIKRIQKEMYLKSFSCAKNKNLMWSHYGDGHKGICIGYDFYVILKKMSVPLYPVQYSNTRFSSKSTANVASHPLLYLRKSKCWSYEKEFRCTTASNAAGLPFIDAKPKEIFIGMHCNPNHAMRLKEIGTSWKIPVYKMTFDECSEAYRLLINKL